MRKDEYLLKSNKCEGLKIVFSSLKSSGAIEEVADNCDLEFIKSIGKEDEYGDMLSKEEISKITAMITRAKSRQGIENLNKELSQEEVQFIFKNKEALNAIFHKQKNEEALTDEEEAIKAEVERLTGIKCWSPHASSVRGKFSRSKIWFGV
jgi:hypothetical protein